MFHRHYNWTFSKWNFCLHFHFSWFNLMPSLSPQSPKPLWSHPRFLLFHPPQISIDCSSSSFFIYSILMISNSTILLQITKQYIELCLSWAQFNIGSMTMLDIFCFSLFSKSNLTFSTLLCALWGGSLWTISIAFFAFWLLVGFL